MHLNFSHFLDFGYVVMDMHAYIYIYIYIICMHLCHVYVYVSFSFSFFVASIIPKVSFNLLIVDECYANGIITK
jgi:hypothetical protein